MAAGRGPAQSWDAEAYTRDCGFVAELASPLLELLDPDISERILDLGCGDGTLTRAIFTQEVPVGEVIGVDADADMVRAAKARHVDARLMDGHALKFFQEFDAVFSNAALHWMREPEKVIAGVVRALKPRAEFKTPRFVGEFGGAGNVEIIREELIRGLERRGIDGAMFDPWYFPTAGEYRALLEDAGFTVKRCSCFERPTPVPSGLRAWLNAFSGSFTAALPEGERAAYLDEVSAILAPELEYEGHVIVPYVRLRFQAFL